MNFPKFLGKILFRKNLSAYLHTVLFTINQAAFHWYFQGPDFRSFIVF